MAMIILGWALFIGSCVMSAVSGFILWRFWKHSSMSGALRRKMLTIYALGCLCCLGLMIFQPL